MEFWWWDLKTSVSAHARSRVSCKLQLTSSVTTSFLAVNLLFGLAPFAKNLLKKDKKKIFVLLTALRSAGHRRKLARIPGFVKETVPFIAFPKPLKCFMGPLKRLKSLLLSVCYPSVFICLTYKCYCKFSHVRSQLFLPKYMSNHLNLALQPHKRNCPVFLLLVPWAWLQTKHVSVT